MSKKIFIINHYLPNAFFDFLNIQAGHRHLRRDGDYHHHCHHCGRKEQEEEDQRGRRGAAREERRSSTIVSLLDRAKSRPSRCFDWRY